MRDGEDAARAAGQMVDKPPLSNRTAVALEEHAAEVSLLLEELDRRADTIINLTKSLEFERVRARNGRRR